MREVVGGERCKTRPTSRFPKQVPGAGWERWVPGQSVPANRGIDVVVFTLSRARRISVGRLGIICFLPGLYAYVGSAQQGLAAWFARHAGNRKTRRWHMDYLPAQQPTS